jgi:hypothetical protein
MSGNIPIYIHTIFFGADMIQLRINLNSKEEIDLFGHLFNSPTNMKKCKKKIENAVDIIEISGYNFVRSKRRS